MEEKKQVENQENEGTIGRREVRKEKACESGDRSGKQGEPQLSRTQLESFILQLQILEPMPTDVHSCTAGRQMCFSFVLQTVQWRREPWGHPVSLQPGLLQNFRKVKSTNICTGISYSSGIT